MLQTYVQWSSFYCRHAPSRWAAGALLASLKIEQSSQVARPRGSRLGGQEGNPSWFSETKWPQPRSIIPTSPWPSLKLRVKARLRPGLDLLSSILRWEEISPKNNKQVQSDSLHTFSSKTADRCQITAVLRGFINLPETALGYSNRRSACPHINDVIALKPDPDNALSIYLCAWPDAW